ncbi:MAG: conjugative relaxase [Nevskiaceae bacterium]|nr:MAG: conjugative relaxase [Nevskiaceae bacterium]TBR72236.1 MAG: conjugative relaxase [Nevskiaceae bacterium]
MLSISAVLSVGHATRYLAEDDYYSREETPSAWAGAGAARLGLGGAVDAGTFRAMLAGRLPDGTQLGLQGARGEDAAHRPGWDLTFSAPKSVSVAALVSGDDRLVAAHEAAVAEALAWVEQDAGTRDGHGGTRKRTTGNLIVAQFRHTTSRAADPQLHSHCLVMNATHDDERWRALDDRASLYRKKMQAGLIYRAALAQRVAALGYTVQPGARGTFEVAEVAPVVRARFSTRKNMIDAALAARGLSRESATAEQKQAATLATRAAKQHIRPAELAARWRAEMADAGQQPDAVREAAKQHQSTRQPSAAPDVQQAAREAVATAIEHLAERQAVFTSDDLLTQGVRFALGRASVADVQQAIAAAPLIPRRVERQTAQGGVTVDGYTTPEQVRTERDLIRRVQAGRGQAAPVIETKADRTARVQHAEGQSTWAWTGDQRRALAGLLASRDQVTLVQGAAGTAKTTTVLAAYAQAIREQGGEVVALAPTASAAAELGQAVGATGTTLARHLIDTARDGQDYTKPGKPQAWVLDEASLSGTHQLRRLVAAAQQHGARLVLVGDAQQLGSVEAGAGFRQLQEAKAATTLHLTDIVRQRDPQLLQAVQAALGGRVQESVQAVGATGGMQVIEDAAARLDALADRYASLSPDERRETLVIEPSREGRDALNTKIRERLQARGELGPTVDVRQLVRQDRTRAEARQAASYRAGQVVEFGRSYKDGPQARTLYRVESTDAKTVTLRALDAPDTAPLAWQPAARGAARVTAYELRSMPVAAGDAVAFMMNDRATKTMNGQAATVAAVDGHAVTLKTDTGATVTLDARAPQRLRYGYAQTAHAAQGRTAARVLVHAESGRQNLTNRASWYVEISRAKNHAEVYTNDATKLIDRLQQNAGAKATALRPEAIQEGENMKQGKAAQAPMAAQPRPKPEQTQARRDAQRATQWRKAGAVAGQVVGASVGGTAGAAVGRQIGAAAGELVAQATQRPAPPRQRPKRMLQQAFAAYARQQQAGSGAGR